MTRQGELIADYAPRYIIHNGVWYVRKDHMAEQLGTAIESAFADGIRFASKPPPVPRPRRKTGARHDSKMVGEIATQ